MGDFTRSYSNKNFKPLHYIVAWFKSKGNCWFCGKSTFMDPSGKQEKTCFSVLNKDNGLDVNNIIVACEACTAKRKYKIPDEYREYLYLEEVTKAAKEKEDPGKVTRLLFWGETHEMDYSLLYRMVGHMWTSMIKEK